MRPSALCLTCRLSLLQPDAAAAKQKADEAAAKKQADDAEAKAKADAAAKANVEAKAKVGLQNFTCGFLG